MNILNQDFESKVETEESQVILDIETCDKDEDGIPKLLALLCKYFDSYPEFYQFEGIFRVQGSAAHEKEIKQKLKLKCYECIEEEKDPRIIASLNLIQV